MESARLRSCVMVIALLGGLMSGTASASSSPASPGVLAAPPPIPPLGPLDPGPDQSVTVPRSPLGLDPPISPTPLDLPLQPGAPLVDAAEAESLATLADAGLTGPDGEPAIQASRLQPQVAAAPSAPNRYRICSRSATTPASCTGTFPLVPLPAVARRLDLTGDGTVDVSAHMRKTLIGTYVFVVRRTSTSETTGGPLAAQIWATNDLSSTKRMSVGFDGFRRGTTLPQQTTGVFRVDGIRAALGVLDATGSVEVTGAGSAVAVTTALASLDGSPSPLDPTVGTVRFSPVPSSINVETLVDVVGDQTRVEGGGNAATRLDALVVANRGGANPEDRFTQFTAALTSGQASAAFDGDPDRPVILGIATNPGSDVSFSDYRYQGSDLDRATTAQAEGAPGSFTFGHTPGAGDAFTYDASGPMAGLNVGVYDRGTGSVATLDLDNLPTSFGITTDPINRDIVYAGSQALGAGSLTLSRNGGSFARLAQDHATLVGTPSAFGASLLVHDLSRLEASLGGQPALDASFGGGSEAFVAAGQQGAERSRLEVTQTPGDVLLELDPSARTLAYAASAAVPEVDAAYVDTATGPTVRATMSEPPSSVDLAFPDGQQSGLDATASGPIPAFAVFSSGDPITTLLPAVQHYLSVAATGVPTDAHVALDLLNRHLMGASVANVGALSFVARAPVAGRSLTAAADLDGVPTSYDADFDNGHLRMRGLSGPISSARLAVTNHVGSTQVPDGDHLAVGRRQVIGDFDASLQLPFLTSAEYFHGSSSQTFDVDAGPTAAWLDSNIRLAEGGVDDTRLSVTARADGLPGMLRVALAGDFLTYTSEGIGSLLAEVRMGKEATMPFLGAPLFDRGAAVRVFDCDPGPGCATDATPLCTSFPVCVGLAGTVQFASMPDEVRFDLINLGARVAGGTGGPTPVQMYAATDRVEFLPSAMLATLIGLPAALDFDIRHVEAEKGSIDVQYDASASIGTLLVQTEGEDASGRVVRARASVSPAAASLRMSGDFGAFTDVRYVASGPADQVSLQATAAAFGSLASGQASLTNVPVSARLNASAYGEDSALGVPDLGYDSSSSSLDGLVHVERLLVEEVGPAPVGAEELVLRFTNLGQATSIRNNPDGSVFLESFPATDQLAVGSSLNLSVPTIPVNLQVFDTNGFTGTLVGHVGAPTVHMGDLGLAISGLRSTALRPGNASYLSIGIQGDYDHLSLEPSDIFVDPDVELTLEVDGPRFLHFDIGPMVIQDPFTGLRFHLSDQVLRESGCVSVEVFGVGVSHVRIFTKPGKISTGINQIDVFGVDGPQVLNYLDPIPTPLGMDPDLTSIALDLTTVYVSDPFGDAEADYEPDFGDC